MDIKKLTERYLNDPVFHAIVKSMEQMIEVHKLTPGEIRDALFLAQYQFEMKNPNFSIIVNQNLMDLNSEIFGEPKIWPKEDRELFNSVNKKKK